MKKMNLPVAAIAALLAFAIGFTACKKDSIDTTPPPASGVGPIVKAPAISFNGIGGYDFAGATDAAFAYDFGHTGRQDYLACYRPAKQTFFVIQHNNVLGQPDTFTPAFQSFSGVGGFNLGDHKDIITPFDYEHSGLQDYLLCYRPHDQHTWIVKNNNHFPANNQGFSPVYSSSNGIGGFNMGDLADRIVPIDYDHSGKLDYLLAYRPGEAVYIIKNNNGVFTPILQSRNGLGDYPFASPERNDQVIPFDFDHSGKTDYLVCFNTGHLYISPLSVYSTQIYILKNTNGVFTKVAYQEYGEAGYGGFFGGVNTQCTVFDYEHSGKMDYLIAYQPGYQHIYILKNTNGTLTPVFQSTTGIGGWDLGNGGDKLVAYDYEKSGKRDYLMIYRPGGKTVTILKNTNGVFTQVY